MLTIGVYPRPGWPLRDFLTGGRRNWGGWSHVYRGVRGLGLSRVQCRFRSSASSRVIGPTILRSIGRCQRSIFLGPHRQLGRAETMAARSIRSIMAGVPFAQPHPFPTSAPQSKFLLGGRVSPHASWTDVKSSLAKSNNVRNDGFNNTPHASPRCAPRGVSSFLGIAMERSRS